MFAFLSFLNTEMVQVIVPFHNDISPSGEQPEHRKLAHEL